MVRLLKRNTVTTGTLKVQPDKLFNKENRQLLIVLILFAIGAGISIYISFYISKEYPEPTERWLSSSKGINRELKTQQVGNYIKIASISKLVLVVIRLFVSRKLGSTASSFTIFINVISLLMVYGATSIEALNFIFEQFNVLMEPLGIEAQLFYAKNFLGILQTIDFWIHIIGGINTLAPLPGFINSILAMSVVLTQSQSR